ncbi:MAG: AAA family ATPase [Pseudanabaena sp. CAN_BIN31]|nr:AAA family ATPase [Pseudanabaena sp. CAN_BIN31]
MTIKKLRMESFRGIRELTLDFDTQLNILIGDNGSGKSSTLDCLAAFLNHIAEQVKILYPNKDNFIQAMSGGSKNIFLDDDIAIGNAERLEARLDIILNSVDIEYHIRKYKANPSSLSALLEIEKQESYLTQNLTIPTLVTTIPTLVHYSVKRDILFEESQNPQQDKNHNILDAYNRAFTGGQVVFKEFFEWFKILEEVENELIRDTPDYRDRQLEAVRQAIYTFLPEFKDLRIRRRPELRMTVTKQGTELTINQLSDGEKNLLAMVGDLARRLAIANPDMEKPEQGSGVVLIDEIELHLHPKWQRMVIPALLRTFPNCQFIITTHSPQVLGEVKDGKIYRLEKTETGVTAEIVRTYGRDSNRILEDEMGVPKRNQAIKDGLLNLFRLIDDGNLSQARELQASLKEEIGFDEPEFARADVLIHRKEVLGR